MNLKRHINKKNKEFIFIFSLIFFVLFSFISLPFKIQITIHHLLVNKGVMQIFFDTGKGFHDKEFKNIPIIIGKKNNSNIYTFNTPSGLEGLRIDPINGKGYFEIRNIKFSNFFCNHKLKGEELFKIMETWNIKTFTHTSHKISGYSESNDPIIILKEIPSNKIPIIFRFILSILSAILFLVIIYHVNWIKKIIKKRS